MQKYRYSCQILSLMHQSEDANLRVFTDLSYDQKKGSMPFGVLSLFEIEHESRHNIYANKINS